MTENVDLRPAEAAAKQRIVDAFLEFCAALEDGHKTYNQMARAGASSALAELMPRDLRQELRHEAVRLQRFAPEQSGSVPGSPLW